MKSDWTQSTIGDVCLVVTDGSHYSPKSVSDGNGMYMASVKDFTDYGLDFSSCRKIDFQEYLKLKQQGCVPKINDILVGKDGARYFEDIIIYKQPEEPALLSSIAILRANADIVLPEFLYYFLKNPSLRTKIRENYGSGSAIPRIVLKDFKRMAITYPTFQSQKRLVGILCALDRKIELNKQINDNFAA